MVQRLNGLWHDTVVGGDHQHCDVGRLGTTGTHCGERLVTRGVDEGDLAFLILDLGGNLVGTDRLGDATGLTRDHVGLADRIEQLRLAMIDVTHHGDDRRAGLEILLAADVLAELDVEALQQLAVLVLGRDDLDVVVELSTQHLQSVIAHRLGRRHHLAEMEQHLNQRGRIGADLLGQIGQRGAPGEPDLLAVALLDADATDRRGLHLVELLAALLLRLAATPGRAPGPAERTLGAATAAPATTPTWWWTTGPAARTATTRGAGPVRRPPGGCTSATCARSGRAVTQLTRALLGHHRRVGPRHARNA